MIRFFYNTLYRHFRAPWDSGPRAELVELVESGCVPPGRAIDLGSGTASNAVFLAQHDFEVTGVDFSSAAVEMGRSRAKQAGVDVDFVEDDLTDLRHVEGPFDFLVDYGTLDDLRPRDRDRYVRNVLALAHEGSRFLLWCFEWPPRWWEKLVLGLGFFGAMAMEPGEVEARLGEYFEIERLSGETDSSSWPPGYAAYLMTRN
jgi:cyclopropane fatty-acyl-phospholipid synthase-like methyltransferase